MAPDLTKIPDSPGVYLMKDDSGDVIYVGKAISLIKRVRQYFQSNKNLNPKTRILVSHINDIECIVTDSEVDALIFEANLIKKYKPRYNVRLKDDKRYPYVKVTINEKFPRIFITRRRSMDGALYFGPYVNSTAIRNILDLISRIFMLRKCRKSILTGRTRACLNYHIKLCNAPCMDGIDEETYRSRVMEAVRLLRGDTSDVLKELEDKMLSASWKQDFETAAEIRDKIADIKQLSQQQIATSGTDDRDVIAAVSDGKMVFLQIFYVRDGSMVGKADFSLSGTDSSTDIAVAMSEFVKQYYQDSPIPPEILLQYDVPEKDLIVKWLGQRSGREVKLKVPQKGEKKKLMDMAVSNAEMAKRVSELITSPQESAMISMEELKKVLSLEVLPEHIEAFDISNISGTNAVGSMVLFEKGRPASSKYRQHNIKNVKGIDDFAMMAEVVGRRYSKLIREKKSLPDLILIDGGPGQVAAAKSSLDELGLDIPMVGLAKRFEHIITTKKGPDEVIILPRTSPALKLLMQIRDEAHRFAVTSHRRRRSAKLTHSELDGVDGIGAIKKKALLEHFGSVENIRSASIEELIIVNGISRNLAERIHNHLDQ